MRFLEHFGTKSPSLLAVTGEQRRAAIERLIAATTFRKGYYLLLFLSVVIVSAGLLMDNGAVIIGGMVMAPLLLPILSLSLSVITRSGKGMLHAGTAFAASIALTVLLSYAITHLAALTSVTISWIPEHISPPLYVTVALCSGFAAVFAWVKEDIAPAIAGIAIAVSLLPPLCAVGIATAFGDTDLMSLSATVFLLNAGSILLAATLGFVLLGFLRAEKETERILQQEAA